MLAACSVFGTVLASDGFPQVVVDRILSRAYGEILTLSDVWQAIDLRLVRLGPEIDGWADARIETRVQALLEDRRLILREVGRLPVVEPTVAELARHRREWESRLGGGADVIGRLNRAGMTQQMLASWLRDDARIEEHLAQRFTMTAEAGRPAAIAVWVGLLRQRAGLR